MKTLLLLAFATLQNPLRIAKTIEERFRKVRELYVAWKNPGPPKMTCREMVDNPVFWDADWFRNYE